MISYNMYDAEHVRKRILSRIVFIQYILNDYEYTIDTTGEIVNILNMYDEHVFDEYDVEFAQRLTTAFQENSTLITSIIHIYCRSEKLDDLSFAILYAGLTEIMLRKNHKFIIRDYLKICDIYQISHRLVNAVLAEVAFFIVNTNNILIFIFKYIEFHNISSETV